MDIYIYIAICILFQTYSEEYEDELFVRIAEEMRNKMRLQKQLKEEKRQKEEKAHPPKVKKMTKALQIQQREAEAKKRLEVELRHQTEEAERRTLCRKMMSDSSKTRPSLNNSCLNVLNNFQGKKI